MTNTSFLHVADVHLDSPLAQIRRVDEVAAEQLQNASRRSLEAVVSTAVQREVDAVVIAGDLFDGPVKDVGAGLWVESQFRRLCRAGIPLVLIRGNHDALSNARRIANWSEGVYELASDKPESVILDSSGLAIHGQSFGARTEINDLAADYPAPVMGLFNIGVLHTSLSGASQHDTYAPTSIGTLESKGYDYWALGHIHVRSESSLSEKCYVGYSGNTQGRHIREAGAKGCQLVQLRDGRLHQIEFIPTDSLRWYELQIELGAVEHLVEVEELVFQAASEKLVEADGRSLALRIQLKGATPFHSDLTHPGTIARLNDLFSMRFAEIGQVWIESIQVATRPLAVFDSDEVVLPLKYLESVTSDILSNDNSRQELYDDLELLMKKARSELGEYGWAFTQPDQQDAELNRMLQQAEDLLVSRLAKECSK